MGLSEVNFSPGWETSEFGSRLDPALFSITISYLVTTEPVPEGRCYSKLSSLPFHKTQHSITVQDHQPSPDSCIFSMVVGQLKADEDPITGFH